MLTLSIVYIALCLVGLALILKAPKRDDMD